MSGDEITEPEGPTVSTTGVRPEDDLKWLAKKLLRQDLSSYGERPVKEVSRLSEKHPRSQSLPSNHTRGIAMDTTIPYTNTTIPYTYTTDSITIDYGQTRVDPFDTALVKKMELRIDELERTVEELKDVIDWMREAFEADA